VYNCIKRLWESRSDGEHFNHFEEVVVKLSEGIMKKTFFTWDGDVLVLTILGTPNAKRDAIGKVKGHQLCVSVTAVPRAGRATDHMVRFLADEFGVTVSDINVVFGRMNINKQLRIKAPKRLPSFIAQQELLD
jgi:uncharacterized protein (TIGR00251 family)